VVTEGDVTDAIKAGAKILVASEPLPDAVVRVARRKYPGFSSFPGGE